ncbi:MAG: acyl-CoA dehydrogenase family protein [Alphaproteobacteria bacterium]|nr:acyl-CoA dehydrogenase family protein [Alphaproteobacteria bacterium]
MDNLFAQALNDVLSEQCTPAEVRRIEAQPAGRGLWQHLGATGFADVLLPEAAGGAALPLEQSFDLWELCGRHALPLPLPETQWARAVLHSAGAAWPEGPIGLGLGAEPAMNTQDLVVDVSAGRCCDHVLVSTPGGLRLLNVAQAQLQPHGLAMDARLIWRGSDWIAAPVLPVQADLRQAQALLAAAQTSGALMAVFEQTLDYANQRQQFGKPIGKFQAIQHNLSILAEHVFAARMAARLACQGPWDDVQPLRVAVAKARTSQAAQQATARAHGLHGAIGFTHEFDLQLRTRRLYAWRQCAGSESHWQIRLGQALLTQPIPSLDLLRQLSDL